MYAIENGHKMPKARRKAGAMPQAVKKAIEDYRSAYKALYGVAPLGVEYRDGFVYVEGQTGVSLAIFRSAERRRKRRRSHRPHVVRTRRNWRTNEALTE